jgi:hypothetical protein
MASSSMDALSVCTPKKHHGTNTFKFISSRPARTQLNNLQFMAKERGREDSTRFPVLLTLLEFGIRLCSAFIFSLILLLLLCTN